MILDSRCKLSGLLRSVVGRTIHVGFELCRSRTALAFAAYVGTACCLPIVNAESDAPVSPVPPLASLDLIELDEGLSIQLAAAEPQVIDPIAIRFDARGRMWVVEMRDYPRGPSADEQPRSRISILSDEDNDGRFETSRVFADHLLFPTGLQLWNGGAFVTLAGRVDYLKDTTGDGRADLSETWYTGFAEKNSQLRANHPRLAMDNFIYIANGLRGGEIVDARSPAKKPVSILGRDFRFHPITRQFEAVSGVGQFGLTFDDEGNRFICSNRNPAMHVVLESRQVARNPSLAVGEVVQDVAKAGPESHVHPITRAWTTSNLHAGQFTAACGVTCYRGDALPTEYWGNLFTCEPTGHLVRREVVKPKGASFESSPADLKVEFLASRDEWFRPVNLQVGPDGALYVVDIYRAVIEHPDWAPNELKDRPDQLLGNTHGRIYRIVANGKRSRSLPSLAKASNQTLVEVLSDSNAWRRESAARLLLERQPSEIVPSLRETASTSASPQARSHAVRLLAGMDCLDIETLVATLNDSDARVIRHALGAAESLDELPTRIRNRVRELTVHRNPRIRLQAMLLGAPLDFSPRLPIDKWEATGIAIASGSTPGDMLANLIKSHDVEEMKTEATIALLSDLADLAGGSQDPRQAIRAASALLAVNSNAGQRALAHLLGASKKLHQDAYALQQQLPTKLARRLEQRLAEALQIAQSITEDEAARNQAIALLPYRADGAEHLFRLATESASMTVRRQSVIALAGIDNDQIWSRLMENFANETPEIRREILTATFARGPRIVILLNEIRDGRIRPAEVERHQIDQLLEHRDQSIRNRAGELFATIDSDRRQVLEDYRSALSLTSDAKHGREVFRTHCSSCHRIGEVGVDVAPDISDSRRRSPEQYLTDIIQPNRAIDANYVSYTAITTDGKVLTGILTSETPTSVTLTQPNGKQQRLLRDEIEEFQSNGVSLMPEGLEKQISKQQMADLVSFIKNWRYLDGLTPIRDQSP